MSTPHHRPAHHQPGEATVTPAPAATGYDPAFLAGFPIPFPSLTAAAPGPAVRLTKPPAGADPTLLTYEHFSLVMSADRKLTFVTAVNIDGAQLRDVVRKTGKVKPGVVANLPTAAVSAAEADTGTFVDDPRIPAADQTGNAFYAKETPRIFDRGHQVRREDPNWGTDAEAEQANADTFHYTNACPQASAFNENAKFWPSIEDYVLTNTQAEKVKVSVFTGPVLAATDPLYRGVAVPVRFFKIVAFVEGGALKAVAMVASQAQFLTSLTPAAEAEAAAPGGFGNLGAAAEYQTTVAAVESLTGLDFGPLREADVMAGAGTSPAAFHPLKEFADLRLGSGHHPHRAPHPPAK